MLVVGAERVSVDVEVGALEPADTPQWGGLLRDVPAGLAAAMLRCGQGLCLPDGQARVVRIAARSHRDTHERWAAPFLGEGPIPNS